jgi:hypothetical protein
MAIVTGCRESKFSLHIKMSNLKFDSPVLSMPLVVFEIARSFAVDNTVLLMEHIEIDKVS